MYGKVILKMYILNVKLYGVGWIKVVEIKFHGGLCEHSNKSYGFLRI